MQPSFRTRLLVAGLSALMLCSGLPAEAAAFPPVVRLAGVPFTSQAPAGNWSQPWQDFCEEASIVMAAHYLWKYPLSRTLAEQEMLIIKSYEEIIYHHYRDTSTEETAGILSNLYGFTDVSTRLVSGVDDIKQELAAGHLVIVPASGVLLRNPHFIGQGPRYHMLVIFGYDDTRGIFIAHDPGTRFGAHYEYSQQLLYRAIRDWNNGAIESGEKRIIVVPAAAVRGLTRTRTIKNDIHRF